jgi:hypothetical protein
MDYEIQTPGTVKPRIVYVIPDGGVEDVRGYSVPGTVRAVKRTYTFLFTVYAETLEKLRSILALMVSDTGPFEGVVYSLTSPEVSGGSRWLETGKRIFRNKAKRNEADATYEWVSELYYETIVNNPQF